MPVAFLMAALCSGLTMALVWFAMGGTALGAFVVYVLSGHLILAGLLAHAAFRSFR
ncbi:MAG: hypothetical protein ABJL67_11965 [Sulfitobacter sp.]